MKAESVLSFYLVASCVFPGIWQVYNYMPPSPEPYTPLTGHTEITEVTGSTLPV